MHFPLSPKTPGSWQPQSRSRLCEGQAAKGSHKEPRQLPPTFHVSVNTTTASRPEQKVLLHASGSVTGDKVHSCVATAREDQSTVTPSPSRCPLGQEERGVTPSAPRISAATPEPHGNGIAGARAWEQGCPRPGVLALPDLQRGARLCTVVWLSCAHTHTHTFFLYIHSHSGLSQEMGHSFPCATAGLCRLSTLNEVVASTNPELPVLPTPSPQQPRV